MYSLAKAYISRSALRHNVKLLLQKAAGTPLCAVVKANAYGHDALIVARALSGAAVAFWGVATPEEAIELKQEAKVQAPILIFRPLEAYASGKTLRDQVDLMIELGLRATVSNQAGLNMLAAGAVRRGKPAFVHIKTDTGMGRNGCLPEEAIELILRGRAMSGLQIEGLYSHFASADEENLEFARQQLTKFKSLVRSLAGHAIRLPLYHMAGSAAIFSLPRARLDMIRAGKSLYGFVGNNFKRGARRLQPALRLEASLVMTKWIKPGYTCGYGATFVARRKTRIGLLPIGYADGYSRNWSNAGWVDFNRQLAPVIGRISMDFTTVDLTNIHGVDIGSQACLISNRRNDPHSVESMATQLNTIPHEISSILGKRVQRIMAP